jgi:hypothetical protein
MNWYKTSQAVSYTKVRRKDYFKFHKLLIKGIIDEELLFKMTEDLKEAVNFILYNSERYHNPDIAQRCPYCGQNGLSWSVGKGDVTEDDYDNDYPISHLEGGHWDCDNCGKEMGFEQYFQENADEKGRWIYTEQGRSLIDAVQAIDQSKNIRDKIAAFEIAIQYIHGSGRMSDWLIEGGDKTIDQFRGYL